MAPTCQNLKITYGSFNWVQPHTQKFLTGFSHILSPNSPSSTILSQGCVIGTASMSREGKLNAHSKDRGGSREPTVAGVQLSCQTVVIFLMTFPNIIVSARKKGQTTARTE